LLVDATQLGLRRLVSVGSIVRAGRAGPPGPDGPAGSGRSGWPVSRYGTANRYGTAEHYGPAASAPA